MTSRLHNNSYKLFRNTIAHTPPLDYYKLVTDIGYSIKGIFLRIAESALESLLFG
jgi:hypothetical protein